MTMRQNFRFLALELLIYILILTAGENRFEVSYNVIVYNAYVTHTHTHQV